MFSSLRFRLPAFFLAGVVIAGLDLDRGRGPAVPAAHPLAEPLPAQARGARADRALRRSRRSARATRAVRRPTSPRPSSRRRPARASSTSASRSSPARPRGCASCRSRSVDWEALQDGRVITFDFTPPGEHKSFLAVGQPLQLAGRKKSPTFGALIVAKPKTDADARLAVARRAAASSRSGSGSSSRRCSPGTCRGGSPTPVLALAKAADQVAEGKYDIDVPDVPASDEVGHLAERFRQMASRLAEAEEQERNFLMSVSHELRTPLTAIRGHVDALREGLIVEDPEPRAASLDVIGDRGRPARAARRRRARPRQARRAPVHGAAARRWTWAAWSTRSTSPSARRRGGAGSTTRATRTRGR